MNGTRPIPHLPFDHFSHFFFSLLSITIINRELYRKCELESTISVNRSRMFLNVKCWATVVGFSDICPLDELDSSSCSGFEKLLVNTVTEGAARARDGKMMPYKTHPRSQGSLRSSLSTKCFSVQTKSNLAIVPAVQKLRKEIPQRHAARDHQGGDMLTCYKIVVSTIPHIFHCGDVFIHSVHFG